MTPAQQSALLIAGRAYLDRWQVYLRDNPQADAAIIEAAMQRGEPPPDLRPPTEETAVSAWELSYPVAHRVYWQIRGALQESDGRERPHHHRVATLAIHEAFPGKPDRARLGLPATARELASLLGVSERALRGYRANYRPVFDTTRNTVREAFISGYYGRVFEALGETAATIGRDGSADRRLFMQLAGDLIDRTDITTGGQAITYITENRGNGD